MGPSPDPGRAAEARHRRGASTVWEILHAQAAGILAVGSCASTTCCGRDCTCWYSSSTAPAGCTSAASLPARPVGGPWHKPGIALSPGQRSGQITFLIRGRGPGLHRLVRRRISGRRLVGTVRRAVPGRTLILGEDAAARRPHRVSNALQHGQAAPGHRTACPRRDRDTPRATVTDPGTARIRRRPVLGSLIDEYTHAA